MFNRSKSSTTQNVTEIVTDQRTAGAEGMTVGSGGRVTITGSNAADLLRVGLEGTMGPLENILARGLSAGRETMKAAQMSVQEASRSASDLAEQAVAGATGERVATRWDDYIPWIIGGLFVIGGFILWRS